MINVLRGALTRRLFLIFLGLALVPTILLLIVPAYLQIQSEQERVALLQFQLEEWAEGIFSRLSVSKADNYFQALDPRINSLEILADQIAAIPVENWEENGFISSTIHKAAAIDNAICSITLDEAEDYLYPEPIGGTQILVDRTSSGNQLFIRVPVQRNTSLIGMISVELCVEYVVNLIPQFGLAENATLMLVDSSLSIIGIPEWGQSSTLLAYLSDQQAHVDDSNFPNFIGGNIYGYLMQNNFHSYLQSRDTFVLPVDMDDNLFYMAGSPIGDTFLWVLLMLPRDAIFSQAELYGANLAVSVPAIVSQALLSVIGFILVISVGAILSLRSVAKPINELSAGAQDVSRGNLDNRVPEDGPGEMKDLAAAFNNMVDSIEEYRDSLTEKQGELETSLMIRDQEFTQINQAAELITTGGGLAEKLSVSLEILRSTYQYDSAVIFMVGERDYLIPAARYSNSDQLMDQSQVMLYAQKALKDNIEYKFQRDMGDGKFVSIAVSPIRFRNEVIGILVLEWLGDSTLEESEQAFLLAFTRQIAVIIENSRLQNQERNLLVAEERNHMARELHDSISQSLFSLSMIAEGLQVKQKELGLTEANEQALDLLVTHAKQIRTDLKEMIAEMRPVSQSGNDIEEIVHGHISRLKRVASIQTELEMDISKCNIQDMFIQNIDRIIQEALSNIARHSKAEEVGLSLTCRENILSLEITDNGIGFDPREKLKKRNSFGLMNMRERAELLGGTFHVDSSSDKGTIISISLPVQAEV